MTAIEPTQSDIAEDWLKSNPGPHGLKDISEGLGLKYQNAAALMSSMNRQGRAQRVDKGTYAAAGEAIAPPASKTRQTTKKARAKKVAAHRTKSANGNTEAQFAMAAQVINSRLFEVVREQPPGVLLRDSEGNLFLNVPVRMTVDLGAGAIDLGTVRT